LCVPWTFPVTCDYHDFGAIGAACMQMVAQPHGIEITHADAQTALAAMKCLPPHPDVPTGLKNVKDAGFRMYPLTNSVTAVMEAQLEYAGITPYFDGRFSVEELNIYKPHPRTYHRAAHKVGVPIGNCMLVAVHGWDVTVATVAGMRAAFLERPGKDRYPLGPEIEISGRDMISIADQLAAMPK
jgi:2-haloacid dehalogenase